MKKLFFAAIVPILVGVAIWWLTKSEDSPFWQPPSPPEIQSFEASAPRVLLGDQATLTWRVLGRKTKAHLLPGIGEVPLAGTQTVGPKITTEYTLAANNKKGTDTQTLIVIVNGRIERHLFHTDRPGIIEPDLASWSTGVIRADGPSNIYVHLQPEITLESGARLDAEALKKIIDSEAARITGYVECNVVDPLIVDVYFKGGNEPRVLNELATIPIRVRVE